MAKLNLEVDTVTGTLTVKVDGEEQTDVEYVSVGKSRKDMGYDYDKGGIKYEDTYCFDVTCRVLKDGIRKTMSICASKQGMTKTDGDVEATRNNIFKYLKPGAK